VLEQAIFGGAKNILPRNNLPLRICYSSWLLINSTLKHEVNDTVLLLESDSFMH